AAEILGVEPKDCLVIEDSTNGIKASLSAGMKSVGFVNPHSGLQDVSKASAVVDSFYKVTYDYLKRICSNVEH
ncbi:MAG TPA: HAD-IA family hydrolase, partial [Bacillota bacterium]|nr:HAD-IA family hydrolase [Bacillota bacterium]